MIRQQIHKISTIDVFGQILLNKKNFEEIVVEWAGALFSPYEMVCIQFSSCLAIIYLLYFYMASGCTKPLVKKKKVKNINAKNN